MHAYLVAPAMQAPGHIPWAWEAAGPQCAVSIGALAACGVPLQLQLQLPPPQPVPPSAAHPAAALPPTVPQLVVQHPLPPAAAHPAAALPPTVPQLVVQQPVAPAAPAAALPPTMPQLMAQQSVVLAAAPGPLAGSLPPTVPHVPTVPQLAAPQQLAQPKSASAALQQPAKCGRKPLVLTEAERAAKLAREREQNRLMQKQRRQRYKEEALALQQQHEECMAELERARASHSSLQRINGMLELLLGVREESLDVLHRCKAESTQAQQLPPLSTTARRSLELAAGASSPTQRVREMLSGAGSSFEGARDAPAAGAAGPAACDSMGGTLPLLSAGAAAGLGDVSLSLSSLGSLPPGSFWEPAADWATVRSTVSVGSTPKEQEGEGEVAAPLTRTPNAPMQPGTPNSAADAGSRRVFGAASSGSRGSLETRQYRAEWTVHHGFQDEGDKDLRDWLDAVEADPQVLEEIRTCTPQHFIKCWRAFAGRVRDILIEYDMTKNPNTLLLRLKPLMEAWAATMMLMLKEKPVCVQQLFASSAGHGLSEKEAWEKCQSIAAALMLTPAQYQRYMALREAYLRKAQELRERLRRAVASIHKASSKALAVDGEGLGGIMSRYLQVTEATAELSAAPAEEFATLLEFFVGVGQVMSPLQKARILAMAYPHFPDTLQISEAVKQLGLLA